MDSSMNLTLKPKEIIIPQEEKNPEVDVISHLQKMKAPTKPIEAPDGSRLLGTRAYKRKVQKLMEKYNKTIVVRQYTEQSVKDWVDQRRFI
jgi:hypothetical protein